MPDQDRLYVRTPEFARVAERIEYVTTLTSRLNVLPFDDKAARTALLSDIFGRPLPATATVYRPSSRTTDFAPSSASTSS
ncbi:hypothetical protein [Streptomyces sp. NPDC001661]